MSASASYKTAPAVVGTSAAAFDSILSLSAGLAWALLELLSYMVAGPYFIKLLQANPKLANQPKKQRDTAVQMCPRLVCFVHNALQVTLF